MTAPAATERWFDDALVSSTRPSASRVVDVVHHAMREVPFPRRPAALSPFVMRRERYEELFRAARAVLDVLRRTVFSIAPTRAARIEALGARPEDYPLFTDDEDVEQRYASVMARPDAIIGPEGLKFIEFNVSGAVGNAVQTHLVSHAWVRAYGGAEQAPFTGYDPFEARAAMFHDVCRELRLDRSIALVGSVRDLVGGVASTRYFDVEVDYMARLGLHARFFEPEDLLEGIGPRGSLKYPIGLRHFTVPEWRELGIDHEPVRVALERGCVLLSPQTSSLIANKKVMAWASEGQPWMTPAEHDLVRRYLPWTRIVGDRRVEWRGRTHSLGDLLLARPQSFVLKKGIGMKGLEVTMGASASTREWRDAVEDAIERGDSIVQERVESVPCSIELVDEPGGEPRAADVSPIVSPFVFGGRSAGCLARFFASGDSGVVSIEGFGALMNVALAAR